MGDNRVLIIGTSLFSGVVPSDKQFVSDLVASLPGDIEPAVWTMNEAAPRNSRAPFGAREIPYTSINRVWHRPHAPGGEGPTLHRHSDLRTLVETSATLFFAARGSLCRAIEMHRAQVLHFCDDYGPAIRTVRRLYPNLKITCLKASTRVAGSHNLLYQLRTRAGLTCADTVIAFSESCRANLVRQGVKREIVVIPWGLHRPTPLAREAVRAVRAEQGCAEDNVLVVASPRRLETTLDAALAAAARARTLRRELRFVFCIKPTMWEERFRGLSSDGISLIPSPPRFHNLLWSADALFAHQRPIVTTNLPPLLWLEAMARGVPVVTMANPGVEETVADGLSGIIYPTAAEAPAALARLTDRPMLERMQQECQRFVAKKHDLATIARNYAATWRV